MTPDDSEQLRLIPDDSERLRVRTDLLIPFCRSRHFRPTIVRIGSESWVRSREHITSSHTSRFGLHLKQKREKRAKKSQLRRCAIKMMEGFTARSRARGHKIVIPSSPVNQSETLKTHSSPDQSANCGDNYVGCAREAISWRFSWRERTVQSER